MSGSLDPQLFEVHLAMQLMGLVWLVVVGLTLSRTFSAGSVGIAAAMVLTTTMMFGGAFVYAIPGYSHQRPDADWYIAGFDVSEWMVVQGTFATLLALIGFAIGCGVFSVRKIRIVSPVRSTDVALLPRGRILRVLGLYAILGYALVLTPVDFPMSDGILEIGRHIGVGLICLGLYSARLQGGRQWPWLMTLVLIVLYYIVVMGFTSYGFLAAIVVSSFWVATFVGARGIRRLRFLLLAIASTYFVLLLFIGWMSMRESLRQVLWQGENLTAGEIAESMVSNFEALTPWNFAALDLLNIRLNQSLFVGRMIHNHEQNPALREWGATILVLPFVFVPRVMWEDKPSRGGSEFTSRHTGLLLSDTTTFGSGTVFEFYVNFGYVGVFLGFIVVGWIISWLDRRAYRHLRAGRYLDFIRLLVVAAMCIDPLARPFFIVNGAVLAYLLLSVMMILSRLSLKSRRTGIGAA